MGGRLRKLLPVNSLMVEEAAPSGLKNEATVRLGVWSLVEQDGWEEDEAAD